MLDEIEECISNIENVDPKAARQLYDKRMRAARNVGSGVLDRSHPTIASMIFERVFAAQELAYAYYLHHGEVIADDAVAPERPQHNLEPPGMARARPVRKDWRQEILEHLRFRYPHTLPPKMRNGAAGE